MNIVCLVGGLCQDVEMKALPSGTEVVSNTLAVKREIKNENGEYEADFINIVMFGNPAKFIGQYAKKGDVIEVVGRWQHRSYVTNQGTTRYVDECVGEKARIVISREKEKKQEVIKETPPTALNDNPFVFNDDDLPF